MAKKRKGQISRLDADIKPVLRSVAKNQAGVSPEIWSRWSDLVGPAVAKRAVPTALNGKILIVSVASSSWIQELNYLKQRMVERLCEEIGHRVVQEIRFILDPLVGRGRRQRTEKDRPVPLAEEQLPSEIRDALREIQDDELRRAVETAAKTLCSDR